MFARLKSVLFPSVPSLQIELPPMPPRESLELVMYSRTYGCPFITVAKRVLEDYQIPYRELYIDLDETAKARVLAWTGFLSVPTLVMAVTGQDLPYAEVAPLPSGASPSGIDRGAMLTEASAKQLLAWLKRHGFVDEIEEAGF
jgi:glutaredoxin